MISDALAMHDSLDSSHTLRRASYTAGPSISGVLYRISLWGNELCNFGSLQLSTVHAVRHRTQLIVGR